VKKINLHPELLPSKDVVFCFIFEDAELYSTLFTSVTHMTPTYIEEPLSQVAYKANSKQTDRDIRLESIRVDVQRAAEELYSTLDLQKGRFSTEYLLPRAFDYVAHIYSAQNISGGNYRELKPVFVSFIMTDDAKAEEPIKHILAYDKNSGEEYPELFNLYFVFAKQTAEIAENENLKVFSKFFLIKTQEQADEFVEEFQNNPIAERLVTMYNNAVAQQKRLFNFTREYPHYTAKDVEEAKAAAAREVAEAKAELAEAKAEAEKKIATYRKTLTSAFMAAVNALVENNINPQDIADILAKFSAEIENIPIGE